MIWDLKSFFFIFNCIHCVSGEQTLLEEHIALSLNKLCSDVHHTTFQVIFAPISVQLEQVQSAPAWSSVKQATGVAADLPDFSFAPQEYITQVSWKVVTHITIFWVSLAKYIKELFYKRFVVFWDMKA